MEEKIKEFEEKTKEAVNSEVEKRLDEITKLTKKDVKEGEEKKWMDEIDNYIRTKEMESILWFGHHEDGRYIRRKMFTLLLYKMYLYTVDKNNIKEAIEKAEKLGYNWQDYNIKSVEFGYESREINIKLELENGTEKTIYTKRTIDLISKMNKEIYRKYKELRSEYTKELYEKADELVKQYEITKIKEENKRLKERVAELEEKCKSDEDNDEDDDEDEDQE